MTTQVRGLPSLSKDGQGNPLLQYNGHMPKPLSLHISISLPHTRKGTTRVPNVETMTPNKAPSAPLTPLGTRLGSSTRPTRIAWTPEGPRGRRGFSLFLVCNEAPRDPEWPARRFRRP